MKPTPTLDIHTLHALPPGDQERLARLLAAPDAIHLPDLPLSAFAWVAGHWSAWSGRPVVTVLDSPRALDDFARDMATLVPDREPICFPPWEHLPGATVQAAAASSDLLGERLDVLRLYRSSAPPRQVCTCVQALLQKTMTPDALDRQRCLLARDTSVAFDALLTRLQSIGYTFETEVTARGQAAYRGGIVDCWPPNEEWPIRLEFFGDTLESIRTFDPLDQRSIQRLDTITLLPARENGSDADDFAATLLEYLPPDTVFIWCDADHIREHARQFESALEETAAADRIVGYRHLRTAIRKRFQGAPVYLGGTPPRGARSWDVSIRPVAGLPSLEQVELDQSALEEMRRDWLETLRGRARDGEQIHLFFGTDGTRQRFVEWCGTRLDPTVCFQLHTGPLSSGFHYTDHHLLVVSECDLYGRQRTPRSRYDPHHQRRAKRSHGTRIAEWRDIQPGELVVHIEHGIGRYLGLYEIEMQGRRQEVLTIEYADNAKIFLPVSQAHLLSRYVGFGKQRPELHALGGKRWIREKIAAERAVRDLAASLLETQAARETLGGHAFAADAPWQHEFEHAFPFEETEDQARAITEVKTDMESPRPMDRLICGDVGYGKTEVAMRAAFKAVMDGHQVAVLVPTTVLAQQHYETFRERMTAFPVRVEMLSRFRTRGEQRAIVDELNAGRVDIVIGTHRLVQPDVQFKKLGLVIVDEEQRFGVEHKEHLKHLRQLVDVLTMTATPIPRTLYLSLAGARDISTIQTPPRERLPVETIVVPHREDLVRDAIRHELNRGGQVFYLHNRVHTIVKTRERLEALVPEARVAVGHGQMNEHELEHVMTGFVRGDYDVLLCTTIIESGVDIPNVNTIIIERADRFGLSGLYQLRGRVGRYKHQAYAYLLLPTHGQLQSAARDRVRAIRKYSGLGSGFKLAMRDLEIRGAGNILGAEQSGHIAAVGFDLYCQFLKRTVAQLKGEAMPPIIDVELRLPFIDTAPASATTDHAAVLPTTYLEDEHLRVNAYRRIAGITDESEIGALREDWRDRFGPLPPAAERLLKIAQIKIRAQAVGVREIEEREGKIMLKRGGQWIMDGHRFPRFQTENADDRLDELLHQLSCAGTQD